MNIATKIHAVKLRFSMANQVANRRAIHLKPISFFYILVRQNKIIYEKANPLSIHFHAFDEHYFFSM